MSLKVSNRGMINPFIVMDVMRSANKLEELGEDVIHLEVGQPSTPAPLRVIEAAQEALNKEVLGYTDSLGLPFLRERIAEYYSTFYGVSLNPSRVVVTTGSSGGFLLAFLSAFEPGDRVALVAPGYPAYRNILTALGVEPVIIETTAADKFQPTIELLKNSGKLDGLILASPSNPTGTMISREEMKQLVNWCSIAGVRLISDEIYHGITYGTKSETVADLDENAIIINSFSKYFSMTGWRLGWIIVPDELMRSIECLCQNIFISPPTLSQHAGVEAFNSSEELLANIKRYTKNREILLKYLPSAGFSDIAPADGAFYLYANIESISDDSEEFCRRMLSEALVATTPGVDFDPFNGKRYIRFSFSGSESDMITACERLTNWKQ
ncbi:MAG: 1-aminocyclopropane-1-carboxylate deaminase [Rhodospirillales bacterium]|nr:1-aminocyclopropane-1-carboxylate deaminase [Rhodospirillales bacterium]MBC92044.1 1-aminocyclopropane-1-carboxylate deaminase [Rhodospirillaceae bacterium]|tara:strand:- start:206 stop:1351 length:1146 start_codon:yes stop_codon:yes gene_type:complete